MLNDADKYLLAIYRLQRATYIDERKCIYSSSSYQKLINGSRLKKFDVLIENMELKIHELQSKTST